ncbi:D-alanyl-D-alanine dipeptidase [Leptospira biflexa]|uniref:M15 family metallopeptidase n=1 Tax=Leptospira biflexa TaxID=172 RepID=UPI00109166DA|nr:M15 family metallopeptidase [Leptospira biflexa]TGM46748.1 D-alanyl-D-alanine dipeptidase [Leptospira biflexa]TGM50787.1 D-alanyl-D-alanine dipeptidase [Leptospira biflexa]
MRNLNRIWIQIGFDALRSAFKPILLVVICLFLSTPFGAEESKLIVFDKAAYFQSIKKDPNRVLVDLESIPEIVLDVRYATENNFTGQKIYNRGKAFARKRVAEALRNAQIEFLKQGYSIQIYDAYRPYQATVKFYEIIKDTRYVASPKTGSRHNKGCAIDLTLVDKNTKQSLQMPTKYDSFEKAAWANAPVSDPVTKQNRDKLIEGMSRFGFRVNKTEWWHFDFLDCSGYEVLDIPFEELEDDDLRKYK